MTGRELRLFANSLCNEAIVEVQREYGTQWEPLKAKKIRAVVTMQEPLEAETEEGTLP